MGKEPGRGSQRSGAEEKPPGGGWGEPLSRLPGAAAGTPPGRWGAVRPSPPAASAATGRRGCAAGGLGGQADERREWMLPGPRAAAERPLSRRGLRLG